MESTTSSQKSALFEVYLRLRPATSAPSERFLSVESIQSDYPTHITLNPPNDNRRRAVEKFAFTRVFEEDAGQLPVFEGTGVPELVEGVLGNGGGEGRDGLLATLGVTGSGKSHTILGSRTQRGLTQLALDVLFRSLQGQILDPNTTPSLHAMVAASDASEAQVMSAHMFGDAMFGGAAENRSRATTPMVVYTPFSSVRAWSSVPEVDYKGMPGRWPSDAVDDAPALDRLPKTGEMLYPKLRDRQNVFVRPDTPPEGYDDTGQGRDRVSQVPSSTHSQDEHYGRDPVSQVPAPESTSFIPSYMQSTFAKAMKYVAKPPIQGESHTYTPVQTPLRKALQRPSVLPQLPDISNVTVDADPNAEYAILISMYEVYNDRIFDLLTPASVNKSTKDFRRRPLLFKPTEQSPDRKVVAGLRKIICGSMKDALMVLEAGLHERRVAGTGSNSVSSRSHGFFCVEVKKRRKSRMAGPWGGSALTVVDLAGSERARDAKTAGATLAEAGKINESLMYLGQCLQMQSDLGSTTKPNLVPFRQCKLTELLFSNSFPSTSHQHQNPPQTPSHHHHYQHTPTQHRNPQKAIMIVTADPLGDFNATSQILRYSALAREITVPRIPSVTSTILAQSTASHYFAPRTGGRTTPSETERETMEIAALEIARMSEEIDGLRAELISEQQLRLEVEAHLESLSDRALELEQEVREEVYSEMEAQMLKEIAVWKARWAEEQERNDEHVDRKLDIYTRSMDVLAEEEDKENAHSGPSPTKQVNEDLEHENERLRREVEMLRRELGSRSPTKRQPLRESRTAAVSEVGREMEKLRLSGESAKSPVKKVRKLTTRKWDLMDEGELL